MHVLGFTALVGSGWYSEVKDEIEFDEFLSQCKFNGMEVREAGESAGDSTFYTMDNVQVVDYDDERGIMEFHFEEPKLYLEVHPLLRRSSKWNSSIQLVIKEGN